MFASTDATLVEVNPLAEADGKLIAADAKVNFDDNAAYRQAELFAQRRAAPRTPAAAPCARAHDRLHTAR